MTFRYHPNSKMIRFCLLLNWDPALDNEIKGRQMTRGKVVLCPTRTDFHDLFVTGPPHRRSD